MEFDGVGRTYLRVWVEWVCGGMLSCHPSLFYSARVPCSGAMIWLLGDMSSVSRGSSSLREVQSFQSRHRQKNGPKRWVLTGVAYLP